MAFDIDDLGALNAVLSSVPPEMAAQAESHGVIVSTMTAYDAACRVAAEHLAFADECNDRSGYQVTELSAALIDAPIWTFWWD